MITATTLTRHEARAHALAEKLMAFLETGEVPDGLFAADMFCDFTMPTWRLQARGVEDCVALRDVDAMAAAALGLASLQRFGGPGGRTPALLHEAYLAAADSPATRARLAAALARSWVYGNDAARGATFAVEAVELAEQAQDPTVLADALDGQLAASWGPDDLSERLQITARLQDVAAHVDDVRTGWTRTCGG